MRAYNDAGQLTLASDGFIFGYIGKATLSFVQQADTTGVDDFWGFSRYTITWAGRIIVALPLSLNKPRNLISASKSGSTWTIDVFSGTGALDAQGFGVQESCEVFVFGQPLSASGFGMAIYNEDGVLTGDFSRKPLFFDRILTFATDQISQSLTGITKPAFIGVETTWQRTTEPLSGGGATPWLNRNLFGTWMTESGNLISRFSALQNRFRDDGTWPTFLLRPAVDVVLIEANGLT